MIRSLQVPGFGCSSFALRELVSEATPQDLTVRHLGWRETGCAIREDGSFSCDDEASQAGFAVMKRTQGFSTVPERPEPSRSDCHAWGAHPHLHAAASILGIRPRAPGFARVRIQPMLGPLAWAKGTWPHPLGDISATLHRRDGRVHGTVELPPGLPGVVVRDGLPEEEINGTVAW